MSYPVLYSKTERKNIPAIAGIAVAGASIVGDTSRNEAPFTTQGLGTLSDCISCTVKEDRNGAYELTMQYPISGVHFADLEQRAFILAKPNYTDDPQPFRIYKITKPLNGICTIYAQHISYDLSGKEFPGGITAANLTEAVRKLSGYAPPFRIKTTKTGTAAFKTDVPASVRSWLGGKEGSLLDLYGGEWHWDGFDCTLSSARGVNRGVTIRYGKNLTELQQDEECANVYTGVRPYYIKSDGTSITGDIARTGITLDATRTYFLDCSSVFDNPPTVAQLNAYALQYIAANNMTTPKVNLTLDFVQMQGLSERVDLCDTVTIQFEELGVSATAKCISTTWDVLQERYTSTTFGDTKSTLASTLTGMDAKIVEADTAIRQTKSDLETAIDEATARITGNAGGYVVMRDTDDNGEPDEILIMNTDDIATATKVWRWNAAGLGYSSEGYDGPYGLAITADGQIVANFVNTGTLDAAEVNVINLNASNISSGTLSADYISGGTLKLGGSSNTNGVLEIYNASGILIGKWDKDGISAQAGYFSGQIAATSGTIDSVTATNLTINSGIIDITTSSKDYSAITLRFGSYAAQLMPEQLYVALGSEYTSVFAGQIQVSDSSHLTYYDAGYIWDEHKGEKLWRLGHVSGSNSYAQLQLYTFPSGSSANARLSAQLDANDGSLYLANASTNITITPACNVATLSYNVVSTF